MDYDGKFWESTVNTYTSKKITSKVNRWGLQWKKKCLGRCLRQISVLLEGKKQKETNGEKVNWPV